MKDGSKESMAKAYAMMRELNDIEFPENGKINRWRVGKTTETQLIIDIDNQSQENLYSIYKNLKLLFPDEAFTVVKTSHNNPEKFGFQIIGNNKSKADFVYKHLKVLKTDLIKDHDPVYIFLHELEKFLTEFRKLNPEPRKNQFNEELIKSGLIKPIGDIDYLYNVLAALNGKVSIRLTKKEESDRWEVVGIQ